MVRALIFCAFAIASANAHVAVRGGRAFLGSNMQPEVVARTLQRVEEEWKAQAAVFVECSSNAEDSAAIVKCEDAPASFGKSCSTVVGAIVQGSSGDKRVAKEYMADVCSQKDITGWHQHQCIGLSQALGNALSADAYLNRNSFDSKKLCTGFWTTFLEEEQKRLSEEKAAREAAEKKAAEEEKAAREAAEKKAAEEAAEQARKAEEERKAEEARKADEERKAEVEKAAQQKKEAAEQAKAAAERMEKKKAEAAAVAKDAQRKVAEAAEAEKEHKKAVEEAEKHAKKIEKADKTQVSIAPAVKKTDAPAVKKTDAPAVKKTDAPAVKKTEAVADKSLPVNKTPAAVPAKK